METVRIVMCMWYYASELPGMPTLIGGPNKLPLPTHFGDWVKVIWGEKDLRGRVPTTLWLADHLNADHIIFVVGDAQFEIGGSEAEHARMYVFNCFDELKRDFGPLFSTPRFSDMAQYRNWLHKVAAFEDRGFSTSTALTAVVERVQGLLQDQSGSINVVSSANHASRVLREAHIAFQPMIDSGQVLISSTTASTCYGNAKIEDLQVDIQVKDRGNVPFRAWVT